MAENSNRSTGRLRALWRFSRGNRAEYAGAIVALIIASCLLYVAPLIPQIVIDGVIAGRPESLSGFGRWAINLIGGAEFVARNLWWPAVLLAAVTALAGAFTYLRGRWSADASESIVRRVRDEVFDHLQRLPTRYLDNAPTGDLVQRCTADVETLRLFLATQVVEVGRAVVMLLVPLPLMLAIDVRMTIASVALLPVIVTFAVIFFTKIRKSFQRLDEADGEMTATIQENLTGIRVVRAFARQDHECEKFDARNAKHRDLDYRLYVLLAWYWAISDLLCFLQKASVVSIGAYLLAVGELQVGAFFYFLTAVTMFIWPVRMMGRILADLGKALVATNRLREILDEPTEDDADAEREVLAPAMSIRGGLSFQDVVFSHGEESPVLRGVSFDVDAGQTLAILGPSGCGKSTIVNLLLRLYDRDGGRIVIDGRAIEAYDRRELRRRMAVVMQEPFLYSKSLRDNVTIARPASAEEEMIEATRTAAVHDSILEFDDGYDTRVGERGVTLSGGQRQRVALARALLQDPAFLILDDALSAVDTETEAMILGAIRRRRGRHTTIIIAHRLGTIMHADRIVVLDHGRVVQRGTHASLIRADGLYRRLWEIQTSEGEDEGDHAAHPAHAR